MNPVVCIYRGFHIRRTSNSTAILLGKVWEYTRPGDPRGGYEATPADVLAAIDALQGPRS